MILANNRQDMKLLTFNQTSHVPSNTWTTQCSTCKSSRLHGSLQGLVMSSFRTRVHQQFSWYLRLQGRSIQNFPRQEVAAPGEPDRDGRWRTLQVFQAGRVERAMKEARHGVGYAQVTWEAKQVGKDFDRVLRGYSLILLSALRNLRCNKQQLFQLGFGKEESQQTHLREQVKPCGSGKWQLCSSKNF